MTSDQFNHGWNTMATPPARRRRLTERPILLVSVMLAVVVTILAGIGAVVLLASLLSPDFSYYAPVAIQRTPEGNIDVLYVPCDDPNRPSPSNQGAVAEFRFEVGQISPETEREVWQTIWHLQFDEPIALDHLTLGEAPDAAREHVPWPDDGLHPYPANAKFSAWFLLDGSVSRPETFQLSDLDNEQIRFQRQNMTPQKFATANRCLD